MPKSFNNIADVVIESRPFAFAASGSAAERYDAKMGAIAPLVGAQKLGYNITVVPPGKSAFPLHNHHVNEEMVFVLYGEGKAQIGEHTFPIRANDVIAFPAGGKETAHQITNTSSDELRYLAVSTKLSPEIVDYPNSGKFGILAELPTGVEDKPQRFVFVGREKDSLNYWEGE